jgi:predicted nucleic acid-binding protein
MVINQYIAVLDACVLAPMPLADTLLRLAEEPAFYVPRWSGDILNEVANTLAKFGCSSEQIKRRIAATEAVFEDALITGYEDLVPAMKTDPEDRHVLAAAVRTGAHAIVTNNKKHFPKEVLEPYGLECCSGDEFLVHQYHLDPDVFIETLRKQAATIGRGLPEHLAILGRYTPAVAELIKV